MAASVARRFNSTLVRFKPAAFVASENRIYAVSIPLWFDSNYDGDAAVITKVVFQFHSGSIQTGEVFCSAILGMGFQFHSGSIQTSELLSFISDLNKFQFHSGSIQTCCSWITRCADMHSFNSTLVRFKPPDGEVQVVVINEFQFHSGSIQTSGDSSEEHRTDEVSIPLWFDSNYHCSARACLQQFVSIPLWFDSNCRGASLPMNTESFQFHSGSIQTVVEVARLQCNGVFQFHSGSIQTGHEGMAFGNRQSFNSTLVRFKPAA